MKRRYVVLGMMIVITAVASHQAKAGKRSERIPLPVGQFSSSVQGSLAFCLNPSTFAGESCSTTGVLVFPVSVLAKGSFVTDAAGNSCSTQSEVDSALPLNSSPPLVTANEHVVSKLLDYDPNTGIGDASFVLYVGGSCNGTRLDDTGATQVSSGTLNVVVTNNGNRFDDTITTLTNPTSSIGNFSLSATALRQEGQHSPN
jgi:hypothetical protein